MKIYFTTSARGNNDIFNNSLLIYNHILKMGHQHLDNFFDDMNQTKIYSGTFDEKRKRYINAIKYVREAEIIILEITTHSLSMGFLLKLSLESGKPVILLHTPGNLPAFAEGIENSKLQIWEYTTKNIEKTIDEAINNAKDDFDLRFNLILSSKQHRYLQDKSKITKLSKSAIVRNLIDESYKKDLPRSYKIE